MVDERNPEQNTDRPLVYQIRLKGRLGQQWVDWFEELTITLEEDGSTLLSGPVVDQSALHGILKKIRDLGIPLLSVNSTAMDPDQVNGADIDPGTGNV